MSVNSTGGSSFPLVLGSLNQAGDIGLVSIKNQAGNDDTQDKVGLFISEQSDENGDGYGAEDRSQRDDPPFPDNQDEE